MARTNQTRKRSGGPVYRGKNKRRRVMKRRGGKRTTSFTSQSGVANSFGFKSKKLSLRAYRGMLWRDSIMKQKWRTCQAFTQSQLSAADSSKYSIVLYDAFGNSASPFWTPLGGTVQADLGTAVPTFIGDIIVRGGILGVRVTNQAADASPLEIRIILFRTSTRQGSAPPVIANQSVGFDMTHLTDFNNFYGKPLVNKTVLLENSNVAEVKYRLKVQKVDQFEYSQFTKRYYWMIGVGNAETAVAVNATVTQYWNAAFVADAS